MLTLLLLLSTSEPPAWGLRARCDPFVTLVAGGASVGLDVLPPSLDSRLSVGAFVVDVPRSMVAFVVPDGQPRFKITESALQLGWLTSSEQEHRGFFFGPELYAYQLRTVDEGERLRDVTSYELYLHATAGFVWFPFAAEGNDFFFFMPWATAGLPVFNSGDAVFDDGFVVEDRVWNWHATVSIGLEL